MSNISEKFGVKDKIELFFIGDKFYMESGTMMSPIYISKTFQRFDWGFTNCLLEEGKTVVIRPATKKELKWANDKLKIYKTQ